MAQFDCQKAIIDICESVAPDEGFQVVTWGEPGGHSYVGLREDGDKVFFLIHSPNNAVVKKIIEEVTAKFEEEEYVVSSDVSVSTEFLNEEHHITFESYRQEDTPGSEEAIKKGLKEIAFRHGMKFRAILDITGGRNWINFKQVEQNDYIVQVSTGGSFQEYDAIRSDICKLFKDHNAELESESDYGQRNTGFQKTLLFVDAEKMKAKRIAKQRAISPTFIQTQFNGSVDTGGGNLNTGNADEIDNSTSNADPVEKKWFRKEVVKSILTFLAGVAATLAGQWIMRLLGWIS